MLIKLNTLEEVEFLSEALKFYSNEYESIPSNCNDLIKKIQNYLNRFVDKVKE